jgi:hypothetical protein
MSDSQRPTKAGEAAVKKAIKKLGEAADALSEMMVHHRAQHDGDSRVKLARENREYAGYLERATWWRINP